MPTLKEALQIIEANARAKQAIRMLGSEGCDENRVVELLCDYCRGENPEETTKTLRSARAARDNMEQLSEDLFQDATRAEMTIAELAKFGIRQFYIEGHEPSGIMRELADFLAKTARSLKPSVNPRSGTNELLFYLCYLVKAATGKEHYKEIAAIHGALKGTRYISEITLMKNADAIRKRLERFENASEVTGKEEGVVPGSTPQTLREEAKDEIDEWKQLRTENSVPE